MKMLPIFISIILGSFITILLENYGLMSWTGTSSCAGTREYIKNNCL